MGTWALPSTKSKAEQLVRLMKHPLAVEDAYVMLYELYGCDALFNEIEFYERMHGEEYDVSEAVNYYVEELLYEYKENPQKFHQTFDEEALEILESYFSQ